VRRTAWFVVGAAAGAIVVSRARRASQALTYDGLTDRLAGVFAGARVFGAEVAAAASTKETDLRRRLGLGNNELSGGGADVIPLDSVRAEHLRSAGGSPHDRTHPQPDEKGTS
jgi:hypothetical protein